ncbi:hypothetical protein FPV16_00965 [Methylobacterium sp. W2]|nr:hypothetical protein [Methylobacterium sp. W2]
MRRSSVDPLRGVCVRLSPRAGRGLPAPCRAGSERSEGEGGSPKETRPSSPPHHRLPPRRAPRQGGDTALSPQAGRGDASDRSLRVTRR